MSEKHVFSRAFITNWDFFCRAVRGVAGGCVPSLSPVCPQISSWFWVSVAAARAYPTTGPSGKENGGALVKQLVDLQEQILRKLE